MLYLHKILANIKVNSYILFKCCYKETKILFANLISKVLKYHIVQNSQAILFKNIIKNRNEGNYNCFFFFG